ncbi:hypothetical protein K4K56_011787 [Colletotrichum sp. SAR 10_98]|nr:hypothetical protein K4K56_011787 [Colletotrichum sp. SAR 10_98]
MAPPPNEAPEEGIDNIDPKVLAALPDVEELVNVRSEERYFMKVSVGDHGRDALKGEFASTSAIFSFTPDFCPKPIAWGTFEADTNSHFYICKFYDFTEGLPKP